MDSKSPTADIKLESEKREDGQSQHEGEVQIRPRFGFWSLLGYQMMVMASWSNYLVTIGVAVDVGGPVSFLYGTLVVGFFQQITVLAISEMASVWPHPGGPLFWAAKLAPESMAPMISFFLGWINVLAYASPLASAGFSSTQVVAALVTSLHGHEWTNWEMCFLYWAFAIAFLPVALRPSWMPTWSLVSLVTLMVTLITTIAIWTSHIEAQSPSFVFTQFTNNTGWTSDGFVFILSLVQTTYAMSGLEAATHLSFETRNPHRTVPRVLVVSVLASTVLCFGFAILALFALGPLDSLVNSSLGAIYLQLYVNAVGETGGFAVATTIMVTLNLLCGTQLLAAGSRVVWSMARMGWVPYASVFEKLDSTTGAPANATYFTLILGMLFGLLYIASETAWNAIASCVVAAFQISYITPVVVLLLRGRSTLPRSHFNLDVVPGLGYCIDVLTVLWGITVVSVSMFPVYLPALASTMNYCVVVFGIYALILIPYWFLSARFKTTLLNSEADFAQMLH